MRERAAGGLVLGLLAMCLGGCSVMSTGPTLWRPSGSPAFLPVPTSEEASWKAIGGFEVGGVGDRDSMFDQYQVAMSLERPLTGWLSAGVRGGIAFSETWLTTKVPSLQRKGYIAALQAHGGQEFSTSSTVADGSVLLGKTLSIVSAEEGDLEVPLSVLYGGYRQGWVRKGKTDEHPTGSESAFQTNFVALDLWFTKFGLFFQFERMTLDHPEGLGWDSKAGPFILVSSGIRRLIR